MGLFSSRRKKEEKERARQAEVQRQAAALHEQQQKAKAMAAEAKKVKAEETQDMVITEMRAIKGKIALWEKKVAKLEADKKVVLGRLSAAKQKGVTLSEVDKRKLMKVNRDLKLTQSQLETLENKLSGIERASDNVEIVNTMASGNAVVQDLAPAPEHVEDVLAKAAEQDQDLEETALIFQTPSATHEIDDDDVLAELNDFEILEGVSAPANAAPAAPAAPAVPAGPASAIPSVPAVRPQRPMAPPVEDEEEAEMRRLEQSLAAM